MPPLWWQPGLQTWCFQVVLPCVLTPSSPECEISQTPWGHHFKRDTNTQLDWGVEQSLVVRRHCDLTETPRQTLNMATCHTSGWWEKTMTASWPLNPKGQRSASLSGSYSMLVAYIETALPVAGLCVKQQHPLLHACSTAHCSHRASCDCCCTICPEPFLNLYIYFPNLDRHGWKLQLDWCMEAYRR